MPFQTQGDAGTIRIILSSHLTAAEIGELARELARVETNCATTPNRWTEKLVERIHNYEAHG